MKTKLTVLVTTLALAGIALIHAPAALGENIRFPGSAGHSDRFCGHHHPHHGHYWSSDWGRFWCPGYCD